MMISNRICPYCAVVMTKGENLPNSQSVEHLIPNTILTVKRNNGEGDFYACRKCNCTKGKLDEIFGVIAKSQSSDDDLATRTLLRAFTKRDNLPHRYRLLYESAEQSGEYVEATMPLSGTELIEYANFLGKGLYFLNYKEVFNKKHKVMLIKFYNKQVHLRHSSDYMRANSSNPIKDLEANRYSWVVHEDECVIWTKNRKNYIVFHKYLSMSIEFKNRNHKTYKMQEMCKLSILDGFKRFT